jgi:hypothetical protein
MSNKTSTDTLEINVESSRELNKPKQATELGKFTGTFGVFALGLYNSLKACDKFDKRVAHLVCVDYMNDIARGIKSNEPFKSKVGKAKEKNDTCKIKGSLETAEMISSNSMKIARVVQQLDELVKEKVLTKRPNILTETFLPKNVDEYLSNKLAIAEKTEWAIVEE